MIELLRTAVLLTALVRTPALPAQVQAPHITVRSAPQQAALLPRVQPTGTASVSGFMQEPKTDRWLGSDKPRHFWMSYATTAFTFAGATAVGQDGDTARLLGVTAGAAAGVGKEIHDRQRGEHFCTRDLVVDALGIAAAYFLLREVR